MLFSGRGGIQIRFKAVETKTEEYEFGKTVSEESKLFCLQQQKSASQVLTGSEYH